MKIKILPKNWDSSIEYINQMIYKKIRVYKQEVIRGVIINKINNKYHPADQQYGLFATKEWNAYEIIGQYTGILVDRNHGGKYVANLHPYNDKDYYWGIDAEKYGNETRYINDYRNIAEEPNVTLTVVYIDKYPRILVVVKKEIKIGEELLLDYGEDYWKNI